MYFRYLVDIYPRKKRGGIFEQTWVIITQRMLCAKFGLNWPNVSGGEDLKISPMYFAFLLIISICKRVGPSFEQTWIPFTEGWFVFCLVEIDPVVHEKKNYLLFRQCIFAVWLLSPLGKGRDLHLNIIQFPLSKDALCQMKFAQRFWRMRLKCEEFTSMAMTTTTTTTDNWQILTRKPQMSIQFRWAKNKTCILLRLR